MCIYPYDTYERSDDGKKLVRTVETPGLTVIETYKRVMRIENRSDCYCCSCDDNNEWGVVSNHDPYCRNHGFAGERPCEVHGMLGSPDGDGEMPMSVQAYRARCLR